MKHWAPYYDLASKALEMFSVQKTITLVTGVRHLKQMVNHSLSPSSFRIKVTHFVETALARNPSVKVVICSLIPDSSEEMIDGAAMLNGIPQDIANLKGANVLYADTASRFTDAHRSMDGVHPKDGYVGRMAQEIKRSLGFHSQKASPKSFIQPKRNDQPQSRYNFSPERQPPRQPPQHQQRPVSVPHKLAAAPVWNNVSQKPTRPAARYIFTTTCGCSNEHMWVTK